MRNEQPTAQAPFETSADEPGRRHLNLGRVLASSGIAASTNRYPELHVFVQESLTRHVAGDWGDLDDQERESNNQAYVNNERILSVYDLPAPLSAITTWGPATVTKLWIITEAGNSTTTILWPCEY